MSYLRSSETLATSFTVVLDPRLNNANLAEQLLEKFNYLIQNNIGFDEIQLYNETYSNSSLLANLSSFSCNFFSLFCFYNA